jgi:hypothetical protein
LMNSSHIIGQKYDIFPFLVFSCVFHYVWKENGLNCLF